MTQCQHTPLLSVLLGVCALSLSGCAGPAPTIYLDKPVPVVVPTHLLSNCTVTAPPLADDYTRAQADKEYILVDYSKSLLKDLDACSAQLSEIRAFQLRQVEIIRDSGVHP